jgi:hypothetical protein
MKSTPAAAMSATMLRNRRNTHPQDNHRNRDQPIHTHCLAPDRRRHRRFNLDRSILLC